QRLRSRSALVDSEDIHRPSSLVFRRDAFLQSRDERRTRRYGTPGCDTNQSRSKKLGYMNALLIRLAFYGLFGWCAEIVWTAMHDAIEALAAGRSIDPRLPGHAYLWMFPIYGVGGLLFEAVHAGVHSWPWMARGITYMIGCFAVEYASGWLIQRATGRI